MHCPGDSLWYLIQSFLHRVVILHLRESECHYNVCGSFNLQVTSLGCETMPASKCTVFLGNIRGLIMSIKSEGSGEVGGREETGRREERDNNT